MRSPQEIFFRVRQEVANLWLFTAPPVIPGRLWQPQHLPSSQAITLHLRASSFAREVEGLAEKILTGTVPLLGLELHVGPRPSWRKDYLSGIESATPYFRRVPYLDATKVGDHKVIWELSRHQHLALLAMATLLTGREEFAAECARQIESWLDDNPFLRGIHWTSALEVAFRALSWIWILAWIGDRFPPTLRDRLVIELYRHGLYLEHNLSIYFSPNTHLLGEAVVLHLLGRMFPDWPRSSIWEQVGARVTEQQMDFQMQADGVHFEQSTYYHVYAIDFFLLHRIFARRVPRSYDDKLKAGIAYLQAILGPSGRFLSSAMMTVAVSFILSAPEASSDGRRWRLHPSSTKSLRGFEIPLTCKNRPSGGWGRGISFPSSLPPEFHDYSARPAWQRLLSQTFKLPFDAGSFGWGSAGHSHSDTLGLTVTAGDEELLVDAGTYTYVGDPYWRDWFRGSAAHNTLRVNGRNQAQPAGPFRWLEKPDVTIEEWISNNELDSLTATCRYRGILHRRRLVFHKEALQIVIDDEIEGADTKAVIEQFWHFGQPASESGPSTWSIGSRAQITLSDNLTPELSTGGENGWRSCVFGRKQPTQVLRAHRTGSLPVRLQTVLQLRQV